MSVLPIRMAGDPVLRQKAKKVRAIDSSIQKLIDDMIDTMRDAPGVGLAANQIGVPLRVVVIEVPEEDDGDATDTPPPRRLISIINPQIVKRSGQRKLDEGCLSIPGYKAEVSRSVIVTVKGLDREGKEIRVKAKDNLLAEALEHEIDHINGVLYVDHLESMDELVRIEDDVSGESNENDPEPADDSIRERPAGETQEGEVQAPATRGGR